MMYLRRLLPIFPILFAALVPRPSVAQSGVYQPSSNTLFYLPLDGPDAGAPEACTTLNPTLLSYIPDRFGNAGAAIHINGTESASDLFYIGCSNTAIAGNTSNNLTIGYWVRTDQPLPAGGVDCSVYNGVCAYRNFTILPSSGNNGCYKYAVTQIFYCSTTGGFPQACSSADANLGGVQSATSIVDGQWHNIVWVFDTTNQLLTLYLDGNLSVQGPLPDLPAAAANAQYVGGAENGSFALNGDMDDVWIEIMSGRQPKWRNTMTRTHRLPCR